MIAAVVPAAGASRRFGGMKLLADVRGEPLLQHTLRCLLDAPVSRVIVVVAPEHALAAVPLLAADRVRVVVNPDPDRGMFSSIQTGLTAVDNDHPVVVLPADMPFVRSETVAAVIAAHHQDESGVVATYGGRRGHPIVIPAAARARLLAQPPALSLKEALAVIGVGLREIAVDDPGVMRDVDRKEDL